MATDSEVNGDQPNSPMMSSSEVPLSDDGDGGQTSPAVLVLDDPIPYDGGPNSQLPNPSQIDSPFRFQGALDAGQPLDQWDYYSTTDNLEECGVEDEAVYVADRGFDRYYPALRQLAPIRFNTTRDRKVLPVDSVGLFSFATFSWMTNFMWKLYRKGSFAFEAYRCSFMESCNINSQRFEYLWSEELKRRGPSDASIFRVSWRFIRTRVTLATLLYTINLFGGLLTPMYFLPVLINNAMKPEPSYVEGTAYAIAILAVDSLRGFIVSLHGAITLRTALRLRSAILTVVYRKVIGLNSLGQANTGQILNLFSNDSQRLLEFGQVLHMWVPGLLTVIASFSWLIWELEEAGATGVAAFIFFFFVQYAFAKMTSTLKTRAVTITDGRVQKTREVLSAIKVIKVNAWEDAFFKVISKLRLDELRIIQKIVFYQLMTGAFSNCLPALTTVITFMTCIAFGYNLTPAQSFAALGVLGWSRYGLVFLPVSLGAIAQTKATMSRVKEVLLQEDTRPCVSVTKDPNHAVCLTNATFGWDSKVKSVEENSTKNKKSPVAMRMEKQQSSKTEEAESLANNFHPEGPKIVDVLFSLNVAISKGQLVGICGPVGSGKSSLLSAILGQMHLRRGDLAFRGSFAYLPQQPWLMNATLRQNIVFADAFNAKRYYEAIHSCDLNDDLNALAAGDQTEIGESGATLSGGQQQRVSLARAVYSDRDIYLLDDPFSSLDGVVSKHVFQNCIRGALSSKTTLLVTRRPHFLSQCDYVVVLGEGSIVEQGTPSELLAQEGYLTSLIKKPQIMDYVEEPDKLRNRKRVSVHNGAGSVDVKLPSPTAVNAGRLTRIEEKGSGSVSWKTYAAYVQSMGGAGVAILVTASVIIFAAVIVFSGWWMGKVIHSQHTTLAPFMGMSANLSSVSDTVVMNDFAVTNTTNVSNESLPLQQPLTDSFNSDIDDFTIQFWSSLIVIGILVTSVIQAYLFSKATMTASRRLHDSILDKVFHGTMRFFEITPVGRILNVFSKDLDEVDCILPTMLNTCQVLLWSTLFFLLSVVIIFPLFILALPVLLIIFAYTLLLYGVTAREVKRRENASRSPFFGHVNTTLNGLTSLHAYEKEKLFEREFIRLQDDHSALTFLLVGSIRWMSVRMDFIVALSSSLVAFFIVFMHGQIAPSFAAMALIYCSSLSGLFQYTVRVLTETQVRFTNVERIIRYENALEWEGARRNSLPPAPHDWPSKGEILFESVHLRYREGLPFALTNLTFGIPAGKKVAIIGRTGSGKSSVGVALFRLVELQRGQIFIDDLDISVLPLSDLRSRISMIPQDPVLFKGTVRYNLDPLNTHVDEDIWQALAKVQLHEKIMGLENQLSCSVAENGSNFSVGEKQLICLARALLRQSRIIFFDEAFSSVDTQTHNIIQSSISKSFVGCTVITVVHRLHHIMGFDYVLVMDDSRVVEFGPPSELSEMPMSSFSVLISSEQQGDAGLSS